MTEPGSVKSLLAGHIAQRAGGLSADGTALGGDLDRFDQFWAAFCDFALTAIGDLYPGLYVPSPGFPDLDTVSLQYSASPDTGLVVALERQIYLVDEDDEWQQSDSTGLRFKSDEPELGIVMASRVAGEAGPPNDLNTGAQQWINEVTASPGWEAIRHSCARGRVFWD